MVYVSAITCAARTACWKLRAHVSQGAKSKIRGCWLGGGGGGGWEWVSYVSTMSATNRYWRVKNIHPQPPPVLTNASSELWFRESIWHSGKAGKQRDRGSNLLRLSFHFKSCGLWKLSCDFVPHNYKTLKWAFIAALLNAGIILVVIV